MSIKRYSNSDALEESKGRSSGIVWKNEILQFLNLKEVSVTPQETPLIEMHIYAPAGDKLLSSIDVENFIQRGDNVFIDYVTEFNNVNIQRGLFKIVVNILKTVIGNSEIPLLTIKEISPDRREIQVVIRPDIDGLTVETRQAILEEYLEEYTTAFESDLALNFGGNKLYKIINQKEWINDDDLVLRLYEPLPEEFDLNSSCWIVEQLNDSIVDVININLDPQGLEPNILRGPNFEIESRYSTITETDFQSWNSLLKTNVKTSQQIINSYFSGSMGVDLGLDYTGFQNFIQYSSATERLNNFKYKLQNLEYFDQQLNILNTSNVSASPDTINNISSYDRRKDGIIGEFDQFENWLYNEPTSSLTTHGETGGFVGAQHYVIKPYPKFLQSGVYKLHHTTSSISTTWFNDLTATASLYDIENETALIRSVPEHIRLDKNNDQYETFVNMIAQHFDILWTYINSLTKVYKLEEQPKLSIDKNLLPDIAESLGWELTNGKQATQLWQYRLGTDSFGAYAQTGSIFSQSDQAITEEVWRRIVNNLPYLLKTKGTKKSIDAMMNIYGIPSSILSIREYGGPKVGGDVPALIEDKFSYAVEFNSGSNINYPTSYIPSGLTGWGIDRGTIPAITREFRFKPYAKQNMLVYSQHSGSTPLTLIGVEHTGSYSGSTEFGRMVVSFGKAGGGGAPGGTPEVPFTASTDWLPLYNGEYWNLRYYYTKTSGGVPYNDGSNTNTTYNLQVENASDLTDGKINFSSSLAFTPTNSNHYTVWSGTGQGGTPPNTVYIGASTSSVDSLSVDSYMTNFLGTKAATFSGSMQEYREWLELLDQKTFDRHTLNPTSYVSAISPTSSYDTLVRQYTLGSNTIGVDLSQPGTVISSSQPFQSIIANATPAGFSTPLNTKRGNFIPVEETYFIEGISSGMNSAKSQKIRFDNNKLVRQLSPTSTAELSLFDYASLDTNKLGLFYSYTDQINKDIYNQVGDVELDDYIGDPDDEFKVDYPLLKQFSLNYWKKFINTSDINAYIRIFTQFDFALFNQIQQLLPERIDDVTGLLIDPNALERSKQTLTKRPGVERNDHDMLLPETVPTSSGIYGPAFDFILNKPLSLASSSINIALNFNVNCVLTSSIVTELDTVVDQYRKSAYLKEVVFHFSGSVSSLNREKRNQAHAISQSMGLFYSRSLIDAAYHDDDMFKDTSIKYLGSRISAPGVNQPSSIAALNFRPIVEIFEMNPNQLIYTKEPRASEGTSKILPGNIIVR